MRNSSRSLRTVSGRREFPAAVPYTQSGVTPFGSRPDWPSEFPSDEAPTRIDLAYDHRDLESWDASPRYSVVQPLAPLPTPERALPARSRHWAARARARLSVPVELILAGIVSAVIALLGFVAAGRRSRAPSRPARTSGARAVKRCR